jgi:cytoskeletal protein CcmA (bactofilin family)
MKKIILFCATLFAITSYSQNTFPTSGNVGINTSSPSARLDVNGNMVVDSCLTVKDSVLIEKDLRTKGRFIVEDQSFFLDKVYMYDKLILSANLEAGNNVNVANNVNVVNNATIDNNVNVGNKINVTGTSNLNGTVKMPNLPILGNLNNNNLEIVLKAPNGALKTYGIVDFINIIALDAGPAELFECFPEYAANPHWISGFNKLYTACDEVYVGIGLPNPLHKLHV